MFDGFVNPATIPSEQCDPGMPGTNTASCDSDCTIAACGDGFFNMTAGEACDTAGQTMTCDIDCSLPLCQDGIVNLADFNILALNFGQSNRNFTQGDFNYDTIVNLADFNLLAGRFGTLLGPAGRNPGPGGTTADGDGEDNRGLLR